MDHAEHTPGPIALFGSGETSAAGGAAYDALAAQVAGPLKVAVLETPAGFQPNSARVAGKVAEFMQVRLQNYAPAIDIVPARRRGTPDSPDSPAIAARLADARLIFLGAGSPTYAAQQLAGSAVWQMALARHRRGAALAMASAATIAAGRLALPVYEIYKVGAELSWQPGLDLLAPFGLSLALLPHWNNTEGGAELDTSRCFMGPERWEALRALLPADTTVVGIDEHTALLIDFAAEALRVVGRGQVTILRGGEETRLARGETHAIRLLGPYRRPAPDEAIPAEIWAASADSAEPDAPAIPDEVAALVARRQEARASRDWAASDALRREIAALGWDVRDTPAGPVTTPAEPPR